MERPLKLLAPLTALLAAVMLPAGAEETAPPAPPPVSTVSTVGRSLPGRGVLGLSVIGLAAPLEGVLHLSPEQQARFAELKARVRNIGGADRLAAFALAEAERRRAEEEALALLTPVQRKSWELMKRDAAEFEGLGRSALALLTVSRLESEQRARLKELAGKARLKVGEASQRKPRSNPAQSRERLRAVEAEVAGEVRAQLAPGQAQQFDASFAQLGRR